MLPTLATTHRPATDLGYLLHKNPARVQTFDLPFGRAHVFYPEADEHTCTAALPCCGGDAIVRRLFEPLGYDVTIEAPPVPAFEYEQAPYRDVTLRATTPLSKLLTHLYVLVPVLDNDKHYWVGREEIDKLLRFGQGWLAAHPERELIARRYLKHRASLTREALARLADGDELDPDETAEAQAASEEALERPLKLNEM